MDFQLLSGIDDIGSINLHLNVSARPDWTKLTPEEFEKESMRLHCSSLIKLLPDYSDLYFGHTTWSSFNTMNRIYKIFSFELNDSAVKAKRLAYSGYPGTIYSNDDYYLTSTRLAIMETTNDVFNNTEYDLISEQTLLTWVRVLVASALSETAPEWAHIMEKYWSGTYTNQWMIVDYKLFTPNNPLPANTFWIMEEIPSRTHSADLTAFLARGQWSSFNVPFFQDIYTISGYPQVVQTQGNDESYDLCPRSKIFRRDVESVKDLDSFKHIMRYNHYQTDPYSEGQGKNSIASRYDLSLTKPPSSLYPFGAIDCKIVNSDMIGKMMSEIVCGPTTQGQPVFVWSTSYWNQSSDYPHVGEPDSFNFPWIMLQPTI